MWKAHKPLKKYIAYAESLDSIQGFSVWRVKMDINELINYLLTPIAQVALIIGLAEIIKRLGLDNRFIPIVDVVLGLICGYGVYYVSMGRTVTESILVGLALGLSACGLFSGIKNVAENKNTESGEQLDSEDR